MSDNSLIEDLERYRRNNIELAMALNDLKSELNLTQMQLLEQNRKLQQVYDENAMLKKNIAQKDNQLSTWRASIMDLVTTNTKKYTEMMQKIGLVPAAYGMSNTTVKTEKNSTTNLVSTQEKNMRIHLHRPQRQDYSPNRLADLTEESILTQSNDSKSLLSSPEVKSNNVTSRRRASVPPMTPASPLRMIQERQERLVTNGETKPKKSTSKVRKMEKIVDENTEQPNETNGNGRKSQRKAAPKSLAEPKLTTKLRRN